MPDKKPYNKDWSGKRPQETWEDRGRKDPRGWIFLEHVFLYTRRKKIYTFSRRITKKQKKRTSSESLTPVSCSMANHSKIFLAKVAGKIKYEIALPSEKIFVLKTIARQS